MQNAGLSFVIRFYNNVTKRISETAKNDEQKNIFF